MTQRFCHRCEKMMPEHRNWVYSDAWFGQASARGRAWFAFKKRHYRRRNRKLFTPKLIATEALRQLENNLVLNRLVFAPAGGLSGIKIRKISANAGETPDRWQ